MSRTVSWLVIWFALGGGMGFSHNAIGPSRLIAFATFVFLDILSICRNQKSRHHFWLAKCSLTCVEPTWGHVEMGMTKWLWNEPLCIWEKENKLTYLLFYYKQLDREDIWQYAETHFVIWGKDKIISSMARVECVCEVRHAIMWTRIPSHSLTWNCSAI